jgi:hypothetical protein
MSRQKKFSSPKSSSNSWGGIADALGTAVFVEFPVLGLALLVLGGVFFLLYWLGKQVWLHTPTLTTALAKSDVRRNVLLCGGAILGLGLLALDLVPMHTLPLDSVRAAVCIAGAGMALLARPTPACPTRD